MADILSSLFGILIGVLDFIAKNLIGLGFVVLIGLLIYLKWYKPKPINYGREIFNKLFEATKERLPLKSNKLLGLCSYPLSVDEMKKSIHNIHHEPIGTIVGINVTGVITTEKELKEFNTKPTQEKMDKILADNKKDVDDGKFWIVFACEKKTGGKFLFSTVKRTLIFIKPYQIIGDINSNDNVIRVRGFGLIPIGEFELVTDENVNLHRTQLMLDDMQMINSEVVLAMYSNMGEIVKQAMKSDSQTRKDLIKDSQNKVPILQTPQGTNIQT